MTINPTTFRRALAHVPTAVSVVTTVDEQEKPWGVTVGTVSSLSVTPPLVMFCLEHKHASHGVFTAAARFLVQVLCDNQRDVANWFARPGEHRFGCPHATADGLPLIPGTLARLSCTRHALVAGGDHTIVIGAVQNTEVSAGQPLLYYRREYCALTAQALDMV